LKKLCFARIVFFKKNTTKDKTPMLIMVIVVGASKLKPVNEFTSFLFSGRVEVVGIVGWVVVEVVVEGEELVVVVEVVVVVWGEEIPGFGLLGGGGGAVVVVVG
jgi:hypothetical protein